MPNRSSAALLSATIALLAAAPDASAAPQAVVRESIHDAGTVARGASVEHSFSIANQGDQPLEIVEVQATCGCTVAEYDRQIAPGRSGEVAVVVDTSKLKGAVAKSIRVLTNDAEAPEIILVVKANVRALVEVDPGYARFLTVLGQSVEPAEQLVWQETEGDFVVEGVRSPYPFVDVDVREAREGERRDGRPGRQWVLTISLAADAPQGSFADYVTVATNNPGSREVKVPVSGYVRPAVSAIPAALELGRRDLTSPYEAIVELKNLSGGRIDLGEVSVDVPGVEARLEPVVEGETYRLVLTLGSAVPKGPFEGKVTIPTSSRVQPSVQVDLRGTAL